MHCHAGASIRRAFVEQNLGAAAAGKWDEQVALPVAFELLLAFRLSAPVVKAGWEQRGAAVREAWVALRADQLLRMPFVLLDVTVVLEQQASVVAARVQQIKRGAG